MTTPHEAVRWYDAAAEVSGDAVDALTRSRVLRHHVRLEWLVGRSTAQRELRAGDAAAAARASGNVDETANALAMLGSIYRDARRFDEAERAFAQAYENAASLSPITLNALVRNWAVASLQHGDVETARRRFTEVARRERPGSEAHASALLNIGELEFAVGNVEAARAAASQARATYERLAVAPLGLAICNLAAYAMAVDELGEARELLREALPVMRHTGARWTLTALEHHALLAGLSGDPSARALLAGFTSAQYAGDDTRQTTERIGYERLMRLLRGALRRGGTRGADGCRRSPQQRAGVGVRRRDRFPHTNRPGGAGCRETSLTQWPAHANKPPRTSTHTDARSTSSTTSSRLIPASTKNVCRKPSESIKPRTKRFATTLWGA